MPETQYRNGKLVIVSDTSVWKVGDRLLGFEPVVREIENFASLFSEITWIAYLYPGTKPSKNARELNITTKLNYVLLPRIGGTKNRDKLRILLNLPYYGWTTIKTILRHEVIHSRCPSVPGFFAILMSFIDFRRIYWHKYAGNWIEPKPPLFYALQRLLIKAAKRSVATINGHWENQEKHLLSFENPCLTVRELELGKEISSGRDFFNKITICFVGNLAPFKGALRLLEAINGLKNLCMIEEVIIAGEGKEKKELELFAIASNLPVAFKGYLTREQLVKVYSKSHVIVLPSMSEGFPKVIGEAAAYGCVPVVSNVSAIGQYIKTGLNGVLLENTSAIAIRQALDELIDSREVLEDMSKAVFVLAELFTYERYVERIRTEILKIEERYG